VHLQAHVLATGTKVALSPYLYSIDQLPRSHSDTFALTHKLATAALAGTMPKVDLRDLPETAPILADPRYLLAVVVAPHEGALFRWQEDAKEHHAERSTCLEQWRRPSRSAARLRVRTAAAGRLLPVVPRIGQEHPSADRARRRQLPVRHARCAGRPTGRRGGRSARKWLRNIASASRCAARRK
jgi:hypothetical protein